MSLAIASIILMLKGLGWGIWIGGDRFENFSIGEWEDARKETKSEHGHLGTYGLNYFREKGGMVENVKTQQTFKPLGRDTLKYSVTPPGGLLYIHSFSGYRRHCVEYISLPDMRARGSLIGIHYLEIFNLETGRRIFFNKTLAFSESYRPKSIF